ncbi:glycogen/starch/alpha-glucan phosphorylase [Bacillus massiliigorillae]|uniref:glycogen/starch/alpha-glucan phosphorylase n=1 Tax=Bacillus massiliigorillae TaxID=1243664 RepID=UPI00039FBE3E|nr:glycogen/starch/alpha-glucan phosphorylase [Bacillus massiliigorillae]
MEETQLKNEIRNSIEHKLSRHYGISVEEASRNQMYKTCARIVRDLLLEKRAKYHEEMKKKQNKKIYYLCMEFLIGRSLKNNIYNLGLDNELQEVLSDWNFQLEDLYEEEPDAGLGNGGLGRLASCFMDSLATLGYPAMGFSICYEYGLFKQKIVDGWQMELPDIWLPGGEVWLKKRTDLTFPVKFEGELKEVWTENGLRIDYNNCNEVEAVAYDMMISGADSDDVAVLRLWKAQDIKNFDMNSFSNGDYNRAMMENTSAELICKVLYPSDNHAEGKTLRIRQEYFLVSASIQNIIHDHLRKYGTLNNFSEKVAIHINDTHPAMCIPELMRIFMDEYQYTWNDAYKMVIDSVTYTNHTVLAEALEKWPEVLIKQQLPRIYEILKELNEQFCQQLWNQYPGDWDRIERMAIISNGQIRMANLSVIGSSHVNGVSKLHSDILKNDVFHDFYQNTPWKFTNVTNGIAHRRWLCQANPELTKLLDECIGDEYKKDASKLAHFRKYHDNLDVLQRLDNIKLNNKIRFSNLMKNKGVTIDPYSMFVVQAKRLHEYKRQLLNVLRIISLYLDLKENPNMHVVPQTFLFAAKAAPGYFAAKEVIKLINHLSVEIEKDPVLRQNIRVVFLENYCVTMAETLMPAAEVSEQISLAGKEASGTGNMKMMINGALTMGTMDGANVEIFDAVGKDNIFIFGMNADEVERRLKSGYAASFYYQNNPKIRRVLDCLRKGFNGESFESIYRYLLVGEYGMGDPYMCLADFDDYLKVHDQLSETYHNRNKWNTMSLYNIAGAERFAADRSVQDYASQIWGIEPLK